VSTLSIEVNTARQQARRGLEQVRQSLAAAGFSASIVALPELLASSNLPIASASLTASLKTLRAGAAAKTPGVAGTASTTAKGSATTTASTSTKVAFSAALLLTAMVAIMAALHLSGGRHETKQNDGGLHAAAPTASNDTPALTLDPSLSAILDRKMDVVYRRDHLSEVLDDLEKRVGLHSAFPKTIDKTFMLTMVEKGTTVKQILEKMASDGKLDLVYDHDTVIFWKVADDILLSTLEKKLKQGDVQARCEAIYDLTRLGDPRIYPMLIDLLQNNDAPDRVIAPEALLLADEHADTFGFCNIASHCVEPLQKLLETPANRRDATILLGATKDERAVDSLIALLNDADPEVRHAAAVGLGRIHDSRATLPLIARLKSDDGATDDVRNAVASALGRIHDTHGTEPLIALLKDANENVRNTAAAALGQGDDPRAIAILIDLLKSSDAEVRFLAGYALSQSRDECATEPLLTLLKDKDAIQRSYGASFLGSIHDPRATEPLIALLKDTDADVRLSAAFALGQNHDSRATEPLIAAMSDLDKRVRLNVINALGDGRDPRAIEPLIAVLNNNSDIRYIAGSTLSRNRDPRGIEALTPYTNDPTRVRDASLPPV